MAKNHLADVIKRISKEQNTQIGVVSNLLGTPPSTSLELNLQSNVEWAVYYIEYFGMLSPDEIIKRISVSTASSSRPGILKGSSGRVVFTPESRGTFLFTTVVSVPQPVSIPIEVFAPGNQAAIYLDETLVKRSADRVASSVSFPAGITTINIVIYGGNNSVDIRLPSDISTAISEYIPEAPKWRSPIPIETNYVDPKTGSSGNSLFWKDQTLVGGWGVYRVNSSQLGFITGVGTFDDGYLITVSGSEPPYLGGIIVSSGIELGQVLSVTIDDSNQSIIKTSSYNIIDSGSILNSGAPVIRGYEHIADIVRNIQGSYVSFVDVNVKFGDPYLYILDAYSVFDNSIRSNKSEMKSVVTGDVFPPSGVSDFDFTVLDNVIHVTYTTPTNNDYLGTKVYFNNSGTYEQIIVDYGLPNNDDRLSFRPPAVGTYYLVTFDQVGNEQPILSGESFVWDGSSNYTGIINIPPVISVRLLTSDEVASQSPPLNNPFLWAWYELTASGQVGETLTVEYRYPGDINWTSAPSPSTVSAGKAPRENWLRVRAFDGVMYSDELALLADFDVNPEISIITYRVDNDSNTVFIVGAVDDDTRSLGWEVRQGYSGGSIIHSGVFNDLSSTKSFSFNFSVSDGTRNVLIARPYSSINTSGDLGLVYQENIDIVPRTIANVTERNTGGAVTRVDVVVTLSASPSSSDTYYRIDTGIWNAYTTSVIVNRSASSDKLFSYYSEIPDIAPGVDLREPVRSLTIDLDTIPEIGSGSMVETSSNVLKVTIYNVDEDAKSWEAYVKKNSWPTKGQTSSSGTLDLDYLVFSAPTSQSSFSFSVLSGVWNAILVPYDSYDNSGPRLNLTTTVGSGTAIDPADPQISNLQVQSADNNPDDEYNSISWDYTGPLGDSDIEVLVYGYRSDQGPEFEVLLSQVLAESESTTHGPVDRRTSDDPNAQWLTWYYTVKLRDNPVILSIEEIEHSDWYGQFI